MAQMTTGQLIGLVLAVGVVIIGGIWFLGGGQFAAQAPTAPGTPGAPGTGPQTGDDLTVSVATFDTLNSNEQVATQIYAWVGDPSKGVLLTASSGTASSATARTSITGASVGDIVTLTAFNNSYYSQEEEVVPAGTSKTENANLKVAKAITASNVQTTFFDEANNEATASTVVAGETLTLSSIKIKANEDNAGFNLKAICVELGANVTTTSIDDIEIDGLEPMTEPERLESTVDKCWQLPSSKLVIDFKSYSTGEVRITADSSDNPQEKLQFYALDEGKFVTSEQTLGTGVENDAISPVDVAVSDIAFNYTIN